MDRENSSGTAGNGERGRGEREQAWTGEGVDSPHPKDQGPTVLTWNDVLDLPRQILPEQTYRHLQNAGREAALAVFSLLKSIDASSKQAGDGSRKVRKHIEVE